MYESVHPTAVVKTKVVYFVLTKPFHLYKLNLVECLKDIKKFIKYYEEAGDNVALTFLGKMGILEKDLIPIILLNSPADSSIKERLVLACSKKSVHKDAVKKMVCCRKGYHGH